jgi:predicted ATPase
METLQIRNVRSLTDTGHVRIAPITLLVGQNSSGKSTFARFLPMLKQGSEARTREPFLWLGRLVDFGSASEAFSRFPDRRQLGISIKQSVSSHLLDARRRNWIPHGTTPAQPEVVTLSIDYCFGEKTTIPTTYKYTFEYRKQVVIVEIDDAGKIIGLRINGSDYSNSPYSSMIVSTWVGPFPSFDLNEDAISSGRSLSSELHKFLRSNLDGRTSDERAAALARALVSGSITTLFERANETAAGDVYWRRQVASWGPGSSKRKQLTDLVVAQQFFGEVGFSVVSQIRRELTNVKYVTPLRASAERYYRLQGLSVEEIDPQGQNIAMFIHNLAQAERSDFSKWMSRFFGVSVETRPSQGHVSLFLKDEASGSDGYNLADTGFGYSQMLPILVQLWSAGARKQKQVLRQAGPIVFAIEQPELHLHPKLQAKLADVFLAAIGAAKEIGVDLRLVIETHSEQIVSTLGLRVAREQAKPEDINIVLFEKEHMEQPTTVKEAEFDLNGVLKSWPYGFFEANV